MGLNLLTMVSLMSDGELFKTSLQYSQWCGYGNFRFRFRTTVVYNNLKDNPGATFLFHAGFF